MRKTLLALLFIAELVFPQFSQKDSLLLRSLFFRIPDAGLTLQYLYSADSDSVRSGLLAAGNMPDSLYIPALTKLPFDKFSREISFALSKQMPDERINGYLWSNYSQQNSVNLRAIIIETLGLIGSQEDFDKVCNLWSSKKKLPGVSTAIFHFRTRGIIADSIQKGILIEELRSGNKERKLSALFSLNRFGKDPDFKKNAENYLAQVKRIKNDDILTGLLQLYRRNTDSLKTLIVIKPYLKHRNFSVRTEAIYSLKHYHFTRRQDFEALEKLLTHPENGTALQAAQQIRQNNFSEKAATYLSAVLKKEINAAQSSPVLQEYILTLLYLNPAQGNQLLASYEGKLNRSYWYMAQGIVGITPDKLLEFAVLEFAGLDQPTRLQSFGQIFTTENQKQLSGVPLFNQYIRMILKSDESPLISTFADQAVSELIQIEPEFYKTELISIFKKRLDDAHFNEALISIFNFIKKHFPLDVQELQQIASASKLRSIAALSGKTFITTTDPERELLFRELLQYAFKHQLADIETDEGVITVELAPVIAPFSAGNFVKLASEGFFNGVVFHRVVPGFVIQAGDRTGTGWGGPGYEIISEFSWLPYIPGSLGMASAGKDTEGSQWFVTQWYYPHLNSRYTVFGRVRGGMGTVNRIPQGAYIQKVTLR